MNEKSLAQNYNLTIGQKVKGIMGIDYEVTAWTAYCNVVMVRQGNKLSFPIHVEDLRL